jgi:hypothetical protein
MPEGTFLARGLLLPTAFQEAPSPAGSLESFPYDRAFRTGLPLIPAEWKDENLTLFVSFLSAKEGENRK